MQCAIHVEIRFAHTWPEMSQSRMGLSDVKLSIFSLHELVF